MKTLKLISFAIGNLNEINILLTAGKSFFDSTYKLYQKSFLISDFHLSQEEIQYNKNFYSVEYYIKGKKRIEKLIRKEEKYLITCT